MQYILNLENLLNFVFKESSNQMTDSEITETYVSDDSDNNLVLTTKQIRENKNNEDAAGQTVRYDIIKTLLDMISDVANVDTLTFREQLAIDTLINEGIIEIKDED